MDDAFAVSGIKGIGNLNGQRQNQLGFHRPSSDAMFKVAVQELHGDECAAVLVVNFVDGTDIRWFSAEAPGFSLKAAESLQVFGHIVRQELQEQQRLGPALCPRPCRLLAHPRLRRVSLKDAVSESGTWPIIGLKSYGLKISRSQAVGRKR